MAVNQNTRKNLFTENPKLLSASCNIDLAKPKSEAQLYNLAKNLVYFFPRVSRFN